MSIAARGALSLLSFDKVIAACPISVNRRTRISVPIIEILFLELPRSPIVPA